jgi:hypothetical protein
MFLNLLLSYYLELGLESILSDSEKGELTHKLSFKWEKSEI